jgi:diguanylate cyclase (GGDEF)-like protein
MNWLQRWFDAPVSTARAAARITFWMQAGYAVAVAAVLVLAAAATITTINAVQDRERWAEVSELASRQRALASRVALLATALYAPPEVNREDMRLDLLQEANALGAVHQRLAGFEGQGTPPARATEALARHYFDGPRTLDGEIRRFVGQAQWIAENPGREGGFEAAWMIRLSATGNLQERLNRSVELFDEAAREAGKRSRDLALRQFVMLLGLVLMHAVLLSRPLRRRIAELARRLETEAESDPLTGVSNRRAFLRELEAMRERDPDGTGLVLLDIVRLRDINDSLGPAIGDAVLREAGRRLAVAARDMFGEGREPAVVGRLSSDDFAVLLPGLRDDETLSAAAHWLHESVTTDPVVVGERRIPVRASVGATRARGADAAEALLAANLVLREAGRDRQGPVRVFRDAEDRRRFEVRGVVLDMLAAGDLRGIHAMLQPQLDAKTLRIRGFEALARWRHPELGLLPPGAFLPLAIETGHLAAVGRAARRSALHTLVELRRAGLPAPRVALNFSAGELGDEEILLQFEGDLQAAGLAPADVEIEITEEVVAQGIPEAVAERLASFQAHGGAVALDDFGTGAAGLSQLLRLPVQAIKVDRSFVRGIGEDRRSEKLVEGTIRLAHSLGAEVVAEGVETRAQLDFLRRAGCDIVQGHLAARPMTREELRDWMTARPGATTAA